MGGLICDVINCCLKLWYG